MSYVLTRSKDPSLKLRHIRGAAQRKTQQCLPSGLQLTIHLLLFSLNSKPLKTSRDALSWEIHCPWTAESDLPSELSTGNFVLCIFLRNALVAVGALDAVTNSLQMSLGSWSSSLKQATKLKHSACSGITSVSFIPCQSLDYGEKIFTAWPYLTEEICLHQKLSKS